MALKKSSQKKKRQPYGETSSVKKNVEEKSKKAVKKKSSIKVKSSPKKKPSSKRGAPGKSARPASRLESVVLAEDEFRECPKCGQEIEKTDTICPNCDIHIRQYEKRLSSDFFCPSCHDPVLDDEDICPFCSTAFEKCGNCMMPVLQTERDCPGCGQKLDLFMSFNGMDENDPLDDLFGPDEIEQDGDVPW